MLIRALDASCDLLALQRLAPQRYPCLLESAARGGAQARYDLLLAFPQSGLRLDRDGVTRRLDGEACDGSFLDALDAEWRGTSRPEAHEDDGLPFHGGWAVLLGYELAAQVELRLRLPREASGIPAALALRCPAALVRDHRDGRVFALAEPGRGDL